MASERAVILTAEQAVPMHALVAARIGTSGVMEGLLRRAAADLRKRAEDDGLLLSADSVVVYVRVEARGKKAS